MVEYNSDFLSTVASYYADKLAEHGPTPAGVDWNAEAGQTLRFAQLAKILPTALDRFSLNDLGCGYGALFDFLVLTFPKLDYEGIDVSAPMIATALIRHAGHSNAKFHIGCNPTATRDFSLASGIFSVRLNTPEEPWLNYIKNTLDILDAYSVKGFAFNCLTSYSDRERMRPDIYYADPMSLFDFCKKRYSRDVALLHDYGLYEFTILVRKS
jgi:SAM-dependent methyltransferase